MELLIAAFLCAVLVVIILPFIAFSVGIFISFVAKKFGEPIAYITFFVGILTFFFWAVLKVGGVQ